MKCGTEFELVEDGNVLVLKPIISKVGSVKRLPLSVSEIFKIQESEGNSPLRFVRFMKALRIFSMHFILKGINPKKVDKTWGRSSLWKAKPLNRFKSG